MSVFLTDAGAASLSSSGGSPIDVTSGFGDEVQVEQVAFIRSAPSYNLLPANFRAYTSGSGTAGVTDRQFTCTTGTSVGGYGAVQSFRALKHRVGQGAKARFSASFTAGVALSWQGCGLVNLGDEISFGYNGTQFGIWHRYDGIAECRTITVTANATGSETLTLTLNGTGYSIPLTNGTEEHNAYEIADWLNDNQSVWHADNVDDTVVIIALSDGAKSGVYTYSSDGASTGSIAQNEAGVTKTSDFVAKDNWNGSSIDIDPTQNNTYQIIYQFFGAIKYYIMHPTTNRFVLVHTVSWNNTTTQPNLDNPSLRAGNYCVSLGSTTDLTVRAGYFAIFAHSNEGRVRNPRTIQNTQTVTTTFTNVLTLRNRKTYNGFFNQQEIEPIVASIASESTKNVEVEIRAFTDTGVEQQFTAAGNNLLADVDTSAVTGFTGGRLLAGTSVGAQSDRQVDLEKLSIAMPPTLHLAILARVTSGSSASVTATLTWYEDL